MGRGPFPSLEPPLSLRASAWPIPLLLAASRTFPNTWRSPASPLGCCAKWRLRRVWVLEGLGCAFNGTGRLPGGGKKGRRQMEGKRAVERDKRLCPRWELPVPFPLRNYARAKTELSTGAGVRHRSVPISARVSLGRGGGSGLRDWLGSNGLAGAFEGEGCGAAAEESPGDRGGAPESPGVSHLAPRRVLSGAGKTVRWAGLGSARTAASKFSPTWSPAVSSGGLEKDKGSLQRPRSSARLAHALQPATFQE